MMAIDVTLQADLQRLVTPDKTPEPLPAAAGLKRIDDGTGLARKQDSDAGIASPLTETSYSDREHYAEVSLTSSDGLFTIKIKRLKRLKMKDARGRAVEINYKQP